MNYKNLFIKRAVFYLLILVVLTIFQLLAIFFYFHNTKSTLLFIRSNLFQIATIIITTFLMLYATGMVSFYRKRPKKWTSFNIIQSIWFSFISLFVAYVIVAILFYKAEIGRTIFLYNFLLLSLFFTLNLEYFLQHTIKKTTSYIWLCKNITPQVLKEQYGINIFNVQQKFATEDSPERTIILYDDPKIEERSEIIEKIVNGFNVIPIPHLIELEGGLIPLAYIKEFYHISDFISIKHFTDGVKVLMDYILAPILLIILFPISFLFALIHEIESPGPLFYKQLRAGKNGRPFYLIKFRTMVIDAEKTGKKFASKDDPRITKIGRIMRKLRLDEVPQLLNIIKGEMSLIGPRPERSDYKLRLEIKPGLTGWAQVHYKYTGPSLDEQIRRLEYDLYYLKNRSILLDVIILLKTIGVVLKAEGV